MLEELYRDRKFIWELIIDNVHTTPFWAGGLLIAIALWPNFLRTGGKCWPFVTLDKTDKILFYTGLILAISGFIINYFVEG